MTEEMQTKNCLHTHIFVNVFSTFTYLKKESFQGGVLWISTLTFLLGDLSLQVTSNYCDGYSDFFCMLEDLLTISK